jgi:flagellar FliJ protein
VDKKVLARIHRVRTLQLNLIRADEARAHDKFATETELGRRIADLAAAIAPTTETGAGVLLAAAAHFRGRLHQSAAAARDRLQSAEYMANRATEATRAAKRDQSAVEKLMARADAEAVLKAIRGLEESPPTRKIRHDPC